MNAATKPEDLALAIVVPVFNGKIKRLPQGTKLKYSVDPNDFPTYLQFIEADLTFARAVAKINGLSLGVRFERVLGEEALFKLKHKKNEGGYEGFIEFSFWPWSSSADRVVHIFQKAFDDYDNKFGICLHAILHILGLAHEFQPEQKGIDCVVIGERDPFSIMDYYVPGTMDPRDWAVADLTEQDKVGLRMFFNYSVTSFSANGRTYEVEDV
ncbi:hypothetical protein N0V90_012462 [Kalmusia sp. IMI 367209]|nr:hypothetical protein N0V90_012462 [Kalmusia sp. IMI 367209]